MKELKVDLLPLISKLEAVLKKGFSREVMAGNYQSVFKGKGMEFVGFREYAPSDDAMLIDWKASLKANKLVVKVLEEERDLTAFFLIDVSDSMLFSSHSKLKCEYTAELVATLAFAMHSVGDSVGLAMFSDKINPVIPPAMGKNQFYRMARTLSNPAFYGGKFDINYALKYVMNMPFLRKDSILFIISDFIGMKPGWESSLKLAGLKFDMTTIIVRDPVDMRLPVIPGEFNLADPYSNQQRYVNPMQARRVYESEAKAQIDRITKQLKKTRSDMLILETDNDFTQEVFKFFKRRQRFK